MIADEFKDIQKPILEMSLKHKEEETDNISESPPNNYGIKTNICVH